jgi:TrmH family RNA methyltransferase
MSVLTSRDNPKVKHWGLLAKDARYRRTEKRTLIEGPHLLAAALDHGYKPVAVLATEKAAADREIGGLIARCGLRAVMLAEGLFGSISDVETPQGIAAEIEIPDEGEGDDVATVFLEGVQDPSNVGAIIRNAAAFGIARVLLDRECADAWSPKALRAGMGGHFALRVYETGRLAAYMDRFKGTLACAVPRDGVALREAVLGSPIGWVFGAEGRGLSEETLRKVALRVSIPMAQGTESLNVAAAAAICFYEASQKIGVRPQPRKSGSDPGQ